MKLLVHERTKQGRRRINLVRGRVHLQGPADTGIPAVKRSERSSTRRAAIRRHGEDDAKRTHRRYPGLRTMIRKLPSGEYRLYSRNADARTGKRRNLGTFPTRQAAEKHEREVQYFKRR